jgi:hypothetical protein
MRQVVDRIFTYQSLGTIYTNIVTPKDLVAHALSEYVEARLLAVSPAISRVSPVPGIPVGLPTGAPRDAVVEALGDAAAMLRDTRLLMAVNKVLFSAGDSDYVWRDHSFLSALDALYTNVGLGTTSSTRSRINAAVLTSRSEDDRRMLTKLTIALWTIVGVVLWRDDLYESKT